MRPHDGEYHSRCAFCSHILGVGDRSADAVSDRKHTPCMDVKSDKVLLKHDTTVMSYCSIVLWSESGPADGREDSTPGIGAYPPHRKLDNVQHGYL